MPNRKISDDKIMGLMLRKYFEAKGLNPTDDFDVEDFDKWTENKHIFDGRTSAQKKSGKGNIMSLKEIIDMTQEEADEIGAGEYRRIYLEKQKDKEQEEADRKEFYKVIERYVIENGFNKEGKINQTDFKNWCERKSLPIPKIIKHYFRNQN